MSVKIRPYCNGGWEADIRIRWPDGTVDRERVKAPVTSKTAALRWAEAREKFLVAKGQTPEILEPTQPVVVVPTLKEFAPRFMEGYARANQEKLQQHRRQGDDPPGSSHSGVWSRGAHCDHHRGRATLEGGATARRRRRRSTTS